MASAFLVRWTEQMVKYTFTSTKGRHYCADPFLHHLNLRSCFPSSDCLKKTYDSRTWFIYLCSHTTNRLHTVSHHLQHLLSTACCLLHGRSAQWLLEELCHADIRSNLPILVKWSWLLCREISPLSLPLELTCAQRNRKICSRSALNLPLEFRIGLWCKSGAL